MTGSWDGLREVSHPAVFAAAGALGPWYAVASEPGPGWVSWAELADDPSVLDRRVAEVQVVLRAGPGSPDVGARVAASLLHLGLAARLLAPLLGGALVTGVLPVASGRHVRLHLSGPNPLPLAVVRGTTVPAGGAAVGGALARYWLEPVVEPLTATVCSRYALSRRVLQGNVASAAAGALRGVVAARPDLAPQAGAVLDALLTRGPLGGSGRQGVDGTFVRRSCCLFYRVPGAGTCGDCILAGRTGRRGRGERPAGVRRRGPV